MLSPAGTCRYSLALPIVPGRFGYASCFEKLAAFAFGLARFQGRFVHFHGFGGVEYLYVGLCDTFFDAVLALCYAKFGNAVVQLLLFDGVEAFVAAVRGPVGIDAVAAVIGSLALAAGDVVAVDDGVCLALRAIHDTLAHWPKGWEESGSGGLYIYLGTFRVEAVLADGDVLLQGIVDARFEVPLGGQAVGWLLELPVSALEVPFWAATFHAGLPCIALSLSIFLRSSYLRYSMVLHLQNVVGGERIAKVIDVE